MKQPPFDLEMEPFDTESEMATIGSMMLDKLALEKVAKILAPKDFYLEAHQLIYSIAIELFDANTPFDLVTLIATLRERKKMDLVGGEAYLATLPDQVPTAANAVWYAEKVKHLARKRALRAMSFDLYDISRSEQPYGSARSLFEKGMDLLPTERKTEKLTHEEHLRKIYLEFSEREIKKEFIGIQTGWFRLNKLIGGFLPGFDVMGARPSVGKTACALSLMFQVSHHRRVRFISLEMPEDQLYCRLYSIVSGWSSMHIQMDLLRGDDEQVKWAKAYADLHNLNFEIEHHSSMTISELCRRIRQLKEEEGVEWVIVDYLNVIDVPSIREDQSTARMTKRVRELKGAATANDLPILCLAQFNRKIEARGPEARPIMSDLLDATAIEMEADRIYFVYRPKVLHKGIEVDDDASLIVEKNRITGPTGDVPLHFDRRTAFFYEDVPGGYA